MCNYIHMRARDKTINAFMAIIGRALARRELCNEVIFAAGGNGDCADRTEELAVTFILAGGQNTYDYYGGARRHLLIRPGTVYFRGLACRDDLDWKLPCQRLGLALQDGWLGMAWKCNRQPEPGQVHTDLWFSTRRLERYPEMTHLFKALAARAGLPGNAPLTQQLPVMILEKMLEILADDDLEPVLTARATFLKLRNFLEGNFRSAINRKTVAARFMLNPDYLTRLFKEYGGMGFSDYLTGLRLKHAAAMLGRRDVPVYEAARQCGFSDTSYFIKVFRRKFGASPSEYRMADNNHPFSTRNESSPPGPK